jgi:hypothetical protein
MRVERTELVLACAALGRFLIRRISIPQGQHRLFSLAGALVLTAVALGANVASADPASASFNLITQGNWSIEPALSSIDFPASFAEAIGSGRGTRLGPTTENLGLTLSRTCWCGYGYTYLVSSSGAALALTLNIDEYGKINDTTWVVRINWQVNGSQSTGRFAGATGAGLATLIATEDDLGMAGTYTAQWTGSIDR